MLTHTLLGSSVPALLDQESEVLPICPIRNQIQFALAARDTFLEQEGLQDFQDFVLRKDIEDMETTIGWIEVQHRDDIRMMFTGVGRLASNIQEVIELFSKLKTSNNWALERARLE